MGTPCIPTFPSSLWVFNLKTRQSKYLDLTMSKKQMKFFFQKIEPTILLVQHVKGQSESSTYVRALEVKFDFRFEISDLNYLHVHVHIAYMVWSFFTASEASTASKQPRKSDLTYDLKSRTQTAYDNMLVWTF